MPPFTLHCTMHALLRYFRKTFIPPVIFIVLLWTVYMINKTLFAGHLNAFGIQPRSLHGLWGILSSPFLHSDWQHLKNNAMILFVLSCIICFYSLRIWLIAMIGGTVIGGLITWGIAFHTNTNHIGASGLVYSLWGMMIGLAIFQRRPFFIIVSMLLFITFGVSFYLGFIPRPNMSLAGHLGGFIAGLIVCIIAIDKEDSFEKC